MIFLRPFLILASLLYRAGLCVDRALGRRRAIRFAHPVISVGNLTVGGTGKTPVLISMAETLTQLGHRPAILTRGYRGVGSADSASQIVRGAAAFTANVSDEVRLMAEKLPRVPIGVGANRALAAERLLAGQEASVFLLDDGFQHWRLTRDADVVCVDATDPWGGGHVLPWGRLREPLQNLSRASAIVLTRCELVDAVALTKIANRIEELAPRRPIFQTRFELTFRDANDRVSSETDLTGQKAVALSSIGRPAAFEEALRRRGAVVVPFRFADHHAYTPRDVERLRRHEPAEGIVITTEKDWVKLKSLWPETMPVLIAAVRLSFNPDDEHRWRLFLEGAAKGTR